MSHAKHDSTVSAFLYSRLNFHFERERERGKKKKKCMDQSVKETVIKLITDFRDESYYWIPRQQFDI
jgi:predicted alpha/beta-hydrolase family hydrolase